jgi:hypothetical protein
MILSVERLAEIIVKADFAKDWFNDAHNEVTKETSDLIAAAAARRREIIFSVCALESYLLEWTREILLSRYGEAELLNKLNRYFPKGDRSRLLISGKTCPRSFAVTGSLRTRQT